MKLVEFFLKLNKELENIRDVGKGRDKMNIEEKQLNANNREYSKGRC
jgi:hypothetical protein